MHSPRRDSYQFGYGRFDDCANVGGRARVCCGVALKVKQTNPV